jgi:peptide/nickel transport system permease protein
LQVGALAAVLTAVLGTVWGALAGYYRGWVDSVLMRIVDVVLVLPLLVVVLILAGGSSGTRWWDVAVVVGLFGFAGTARVVRGVVLSVREREFVEAARAMGASDLRVLFRHVLPHTLGYVVVDAAIAASAAILIESALSFLGFGITAPDTSLGLLVANAQTAVTTRPWLFYIPGIFLVGSCLAIQLAGDGVRDALDPR